MAKAYYTAKENGRTKNKAGATVKFKRGDVLEAEDGELDHCAGLEKSKTKPKK